ncbi:hypothetical protein KIN20_004495 [Parelaphostrongylus tenuis]|uniref:Uncharacterized protein n=1 Tax=Parelaphostrongylus tenuis TaxID=148309 RepID=A0AAD5MK14_PARTN|nr:hypothetical protein KIN20_004495 [Parelaphostrongylus tenuis]
MARFPGKTSRTRSQMVKKKMCTNSTECTDDDKQDNRPTVSSFSGSAQNGKQTDRSKHLNVTLIYRG